MLVHFAKKFSKILEIVAKVDWLNAYSPTQWCPFVSSMGRPSQERIGIPRIGKLRLTKFALVRQVRHFHYSNKESFGETNLFKEIKIDLILEKILCI